LTTTTGRAPKPRTRATSVSAARSDTIARRLWSAYRRKPRDDARNHLVEHYQPLVRELVRRYASRLPPNVDPGDLHTAANVGLMAAIEAFDASRSVPFESYCDMRVRGALLDELRSEDWLPRHWRARIETRRRAVEVLRTALGREPSDEEVADALDLPIDEYRQTFGPGILAAALGACGDDDVSPVVDVVADAGGDAPGERLTREELLRLVAQKLSVQEYRVVYLKYWEELSMREIGELMHITESRVSKIHTRLLERLRDRFRVGVEE
jgi:RNA polymerase sigma factor for flagellar operon FliA